MMILSSWNALDMGVTAFCVFLSAILYNRRSARTMDNCSRSIFPQGYLLHNQVTHARLLPVESANAFTYPTVSLLVSLDALEAHKLDLGWGWVFGYGGLWGRITGLRPKPYLTQQPGSIRSKLEELLLLRGFFSGKRRFKDAWMMTMPSFLGYEGINPLTVYFCYDLEGEFWLTILEVGQHKLVFSYL